MFNFFSKKNPKTELTVQELAYWEEHSYMCALAPEGYQLTEEIYTRIKEIPGVELKAKRFAGENDPGILQILYQGMEFEAGYYYSDFSTDALMESQAQRFSEAEKEKIIHVTKALTVFMKFIGDPKVSYHLQLKLVYAMMPQMLALYDESAENLLNRRWVELAAHSSVVPAPTNLYVVQAVSDKEQVWLHTHGLCRCNLFELEILDSNREEYGIHYSLLSNYAARLLDYTDPKEAEGENTENLEEALCLGIFSDGEPVVVTSRIWTEGLSHYPKKTLGGAEDRKDSHNTQTRFLFLYGTEKDEREGHVRKVGEFSKKLADNPLFYLSTEETQRMSALARERFIYVENILKRIQKGEEFKILVKIGLTTVDEEGNPDHQNLEHIWFEALNLEEKGFRARLTQEPYHVPDMHTGDEGIYSIDEVTDWVIYTPDGSVNPDNVYLLDT